MPLIELQEFNPETIEKIKAFDCEAIKSFYLANYKVLKSIVHRYLKHKNAECENDVSAFHEYLHDIYISLPYFNYDSPQNFITSVRYAMPTVALGGFAYGKENHGRTLSSYYKAPTSISLYYENDDGETCLITDFLEAGIDESDIIDFSPTYETVAGKICEFCSKYFNDRQNEFFAYYMDGYPLYIICKKMNIERHSNAMKMLYRIREKLIMHFKEIKEFLQENEFDLLPYYDSLYLEALEEVIAKKERKKELDKASWQRHKDENLKKQRERRAKAKNK